MPPAGLVTAPLPGSEQPNKNTDITHPSRGQDRDASKVAAEIMRKADETQPPMPPKPAVDPMTLPKEVGGEVQVPTDVIPTPVQPVPVRTTAPAFPPNPTLEQPPAANVQPPAIPPQPQASMPPGALPPQPPQSFETALPAMPPGTPNENSLPPKTDYDRDATQPTLSPPVDTNRNLPPVEATSPANPNTPPFEADQSPTKIEKSEKSTQNINKLPYQEVDRLAREMPGVIFDYVASRVGDAKTPQDINIAMLETKPLMDLVYYYHLQT